MASLKCSNCQVDLVMDMENLCFYRRNDGDVLLTITNEFNNVFKSQKKVEINTTKIDNFRSANVRQIAAIVRLNWANLFHMVPIALCCLHSELKESFYWRENCLLNQNGKFLSQMLVFLRFARKMGLPTLTELVIPPHTQRKNRRSNCMKEGGHQEIRVLILQICSCMFKGECKS